MWAERYSHLQKEGKKTYDKKGFRKRVFRSKYHCYFISEDIVFYAFDTCIYCQKEINHVECIPFSKYTYEDFKFEFENSNFDEEGNRKEKYNIFKNRVDRYE